MVIVRFEQALKIRTSSDICPIPPVRAGKSTARLTRASGWPSLLPVWLQGFAVAEKMVLSGESLGRAPPAERPNITAL